MEIILTQKDAGRGCIWGALIGDAAGAILEFLGRRPDRSKVKQALMMTGGGRLRTAPGQITDDGELTLCLMHALAGSDRFDIEKIAVSYLDWHKSLPFDIGTTTHAGLSGGYSKKPGEIHLGMTKASGKENLGSKANGALMRVSPLGVWGSRLSESTLVSSVYQEARLTHPNEVCLQASAAYCLAIRHLMLNPGDSDGAFLTAKNWISESGNREMKKWILSAEADENVAYWPKIGFVRIAFIHAFRHLKLKTGYIEALFETLLGGGDTDTNACIVGGLLGALHGIDGIPETMIKMVGNCDTSKGRPRPDFLEVRKQFPNLLDRLSGE
jgi:ADP-ribosyl-[dinitrogen reductase] hydrolase